MLGARLRVRQGCCRVEKEKKVQFRDLGGRKVSRYGLGTKRFPREDSSRVERMDKVKVEGIFDTAFSLGMNYIDTSYSDVKGEAEQYVGDRISTAVEPAYAATSFFELVDPRYDYVFQKQQKKLQRSCIDFYYVEGVSNLTKMRDIDNGAVDFLFERKEAGEIGMLGFSSDLSAENLREYLKLYPWDFVRMPVNFFDWFEKGLSDKYEVAMEAGVPIVAHAPLRCGAATNLKANTVKVLKDANPTRSSVDWSLRFVKSLEGVAVVTSNVYSADQLAANAAVFADDAALSNEEMDVLAQAAHVQRTVRPGGVS